MKIWKMVACLGLLVLVICSCVMLANPTEASAQQTDETEDPYTQATPPTREESGKESTADQTVTLEKTYSEGLVFRSNGDGTCALAGMGSCRDNYLLIPPKSPLGDAVTEILAGALSGSNITAIEIPASVSALSADSFSGCSRLSHVRVASTTKNFLVHDGVLYTADGQTLLYCPAARSSRELTLHRSLRRIAAGAFAYCPALSTVYFSGSTADWRSIRIGDDNDALYEAAFKFNS